MLEGKVSIIRNEKEINAKIGDAVFDDDNIVTQKGSKVEILLIENKGSITVSEDTKFGMTVLKDDKKTNFSLSLVFGAIKSMVSRSSDEYYNVTTPSITTGVRGTEFTVASDPAGGSFVEVEEGVVTAGDIKDDQDMETQEISDTTGVVEITKGQKVEKEIDESIKTGDNISSLTEWKKHKQEILQNTIGDKIIMLDKRLMMQGKQIERIKKAFLYLKTHKTKINEAFKEFKEKISSLKKSDKKPVITKDQIEKYKEAMKDLNKKTLDTLKFTRIILDRYWATRGMLIELLKRIDRKEFDPQKIKDISGFKKHMQEMKKLDMEAKKLEIQWRIVTKILLEIKESQKIKAD
jgi:hypothetical protein